MKKVKGSEYFIILSAAFSSSTLFSAFDCFLGIFGVCRHEGQSCANERQGSYYEADKKKTIGLLKQTALSLRDKTLSNEFQGI